MTNNRFVEQLQIDSVEFVKNGVKPNGDTWVLSKVEATGGQVKKYSTFLEDLGVGEVGNFTIEESFSGKNPKTNKPYRNLTIIGRAVEQQEKPKQTLAENILESLRQLHLKVDLVIKHQNELGMLETLATDEKKDEAEPIPF